MSNRHIYQELLRRIREPRRFMQVLLGPRQVGKTTLALELEKQLGIPSHYVSADTATLEDIPWLQIQWEIARTKTQENTEALLILDEIQKIPDWASVTKQLWDEDTRKKCPLKVILLGSSPWLIQKGLSESLAGRFEILPVTHWSFLEMKETFHWNLSQYVYFGGYPGPASFIDEESRWSNYINDSLIETTLSRDILLMAQINKPVLLRRLFQLGCVYSSQILSYQKMLGQLQDVGNTTTLAHYLDLLNGAGLIAGLQKFSIQTIKSKGSSPKLLVYNTALMSAQSGRSFEETVRDKEFWGRLVESTVGSHLLNGIRGSAIELFYWREGDAEVDFILKKGKLVTAIEVKTTQKREKLSGMAAFVKKFSPRRQILIGENGISLEKFLETPVENWI